MKYIRITGYVLISIFFALALSIFILNKYLNKTIIKSVKTHIYESTNHEYILNLDALNVDFFSQSIEVTNLVIEPYQKEKPKKKYFVFKVKSLKINDFSIINYIKERKISIYDVDFMEPELFVYLGSENIKEKNSGSNSNSKKNDSLIKSITINQINIKNLKFNVFNNNAEEIPIFNSITNNLNLENINVDLSKIKISEIIAFDKFEIIMENFKCNIGNDSLYTIKSKKLYIDYNQSVMILDSLKLIPNYNKNDFAKRAGRQTSRLEAVLSKIIISNINYKLLLEKQKLSIHKIELNNCNLDVYRDNRLPLAKIIRPSIQSMIKSIPFLISIDTIEMKNSKIAFEAIHPHSFSTGKISINDFEVTVTGVQNDSCLISENHSVEALASGYIMNKGKFNLKYYFPLKFTKEHFYCSGSLSTMPFSTFNSIIIPVKNLQARSGVIDSLNFSFIAEEKHAYGTMKFKYHDLKIDVLNKLNNKNGLNQKLKSLLANNFKIFESNPQIGGKLRISKIEINHNPYRFFLNYSIQSILSGIEPAILNDKKNK